MEIKKDLKYTKTHEWMKTENEKVRIGVTDYAQEKMTDIVYVELPEVGKELKKGDELCVLESVKSVSEVHSPVSGKIVDVNKMLGDSPDRINKSPYNDGWIAVLEMKDKTEIGGFLTSEQYAKYLETQE